MNRLGLGSVGEIFEDSRGQASGDAQGVRRRRAVQPGQARGGGRGPEDTANRGRVEAAAVEGCRRGHADPYDDFVGGDQGGEQVFAAGTRSLRGGDGRRNHHGAHVTNRIGVRVVEIEAVAEHPVGQCGRGRGQFTGKPDRGGLRLTTQLTPDLARSSRLTERMGGETAADRVERV
jgi:hypothetical protein